MGPITLIDKSTIQSLSFDEVRYLDRYYSLVISPILMRELLSTLAKEPEPKKDWENILSILASKVDTLSSYTPPAAESIARASLLGDQTPMTGQVPLAGGRRVRSRDGTYGVIFDEPEEKKILRDWQQKNFHDYYRKEAAEIRKLDHGLNLAELQKTIAGTVKDFPKLKTLSELAHWLDHTYFKDVANEYHLTVMGRDLLSPEELQGVIERWRKDRRPLSEFAPYAFYFYRVNTLYFIGLGMGLISASKDAKSHLDIQYLYYLPFCMCFVSSDKHLLEIAEVFKRPNRIIIQGDRLKADLKAMNAHFGAMNEEEKKKALTVARNYPPELPGSVTEETWKALMRPRPDPSIPSPKRSREEEKALVERMQKYLRDAVPVDKREASPEAGARPKKSILERNKEFVSGALKIVGFSEGKNWEQIKKEFGSKHVKEIYNLHADLWHPSDPFPELANELATDDKLRALYLGDMEPYDLVEKVWRWTLHFDQILIPDPFHSPWSRKEEFNPIANPEQYEGDTFKLVYALTLLEPLIIAGAVVLVPDPSDYKPELKQLLLKLAQAKKGNPVYKNITQAEGKRLKRLSFHSEMRFMAMSPEDRQRSYAKAKLSPDVSEEDAIKYFRHMRSLDPLCLDRDVSSGQMLIVRSGANFESSLLLASLYRAIPTSSLSARVQEYRNQSSPTPGFLEPLKTHLRATPNCRVVDPIFANSIKKEGALSEFRDCLHRSLVLKQGSKIPIDELFVFLEEEAKYLAELYAHISGIDGDSLLGKTEIEFVWSDSCFLTDEAKSYIDAFDPTLKKFAPNAFLGFPVVEIPDTPFGM